MELEPFKLSLINSVDTMLKFIDDVGLPNVLANCDISHLDLVHAPFDQVKRLKGRIAHVHLSDCDGKVHGDLPPGRGVTPIRDYLRASATRVSTAPSASSWNTPGRTGSCPGRSVPTTARRPSCEKSGYAPEPSPKRPKPQLRSCRLTRPTPDL